MKDQLEKTFHSLLDQHEVPTPNGAWDSFQEYKQNQPSVGQNTAAGKYWALGLSACAAIVSVIFLTLTNNETPTAPLVAKEIQSELNGIQSAAKQEAQTNIQENAVTEKEKSLPTKQTEETIKPSKNINPAHHSEVIPATIASEHSEEEKETNSGKPVENNNAGIPVRNAGTNTNKYIAGTLSATAICAKDAITISNPAIGEQFVKFRIGKKEFTLKPGHTMDVIPTSSTEVSFLDELNQLIAVVPITVHALPTPSISVEGNIYENGIPVVHTAVNGSYAEIHWSSGKQQVQNEYHAQFSFFEKGTYPIAVEVTDHNGCKGTKVTDVVIDQNYNLLAVDAFRPNHHDLRLRKFIPFALTQRATPFEFTIIDPKDNGVVFQTQDANQAWDGTDNRNGKMSPPNTMYIWQVKLAEPLLGEKSVYIGTIIHD